jgi:hypothetical protein
VDVLFFDFSNAFDKAPHRRLLSKFKAHGIGGIMNGWIEQWLQEREQTLVINGQASEWTKVSSGVPQRSVLGPTVFLIDIHYNNDIVTSRIL